MPAPHRPGDRPLSPSVSVVIPVAPAQDERLPALLATLPPVHEVIVVVGRDADTVRTLPRAARVIRQTRTGAGNALACGVAVATGDLVVTQPGDGSGDPADLPRLVETLRAGADVVEGHRPAGRLDLILLWLTAVLLGCRPAGPATGYRAFWRRHSGRLGLPRVAGTEPARGDGHDGELLVAVRTRAAGLRVTGIPVTARPRISGAALSGGVRAVTGEWLARRREVRTSETESSATESIVVMTGGPAVNRPYPGPNRYHGSRPVTGPMIVTGAPLNAPRTPMADRQVFDEALRRWPAANRTPGAVDHRNAPGDRRRGGERRGPERRRTDSAPDRRTTDAGRPSGGETHHRRRWRDHRDQETGRPDLRVINGEGGGSGGGRGHLRSV